MKTILTGLILAGTIVACNNKPSTSVTGNTTAVTPSDTVGLSAYRQFKAQNTTTQYQNLQSNQAYTQPSAERVYNEEPRSFGGRTRTSRSSYYHNHGSYSPAYTSTSESGHAAYRKKGMSSGAKDAIIGGAGGAIVGAVADKKNRGVGALIGGVVGGAAGYGLGHSKDKKRY